MKNQALKSTTSSYPEFKTAGRLIVLVPCLEADLRLITRRIWELAESTHSDIKFIGLCNDPIQEPSLRRILVTLCAMLSYDNVTAQHELIFGKDWLKAVKLSLQSEDMVVCFGEQRVGALQTPLSQVLQSGLPVPLYILSGLFPNANSRLNWFSQVGAWIGFVVIILGFFVLQINIYHLATNWTTLLVSLSIVVEFWLIWAWHNTSHHL